MIYFDNAATGGKKPPSVIRAVTRGLTEFCANPGRSGHSISQNAAMQIYDTRQKLSDFFGSDGAQTVIFTANCTASLNFVIKGVLSRGDHVVVSDLEHNAVMRPIVAAGIEYSTATVSFENDGETVESFKSKIKGNTKMIICTGASNVTGKILPIEALGRLCRDVDVLFAVDAAQSGGVVPINMQKQHIDYLCVAPHKGLYAPMGIGVLIARKPIKRSVIEGGTGIDSINLYQEPIIPEGFESGTVNLPAILGTRAGIEFVKKTGIKKIHNSEMQLIRQVYNSFLNDPKIVIYTGLDDVNSFAPVMSFNVKGFSSGEVADWLNKNGIAVRAGLHCAPSAHKRLNTLQTGTVRAAPSVFNTQNDALRLINAVKNIKKTSK